MNAPGWAPTSGTVHLNLGTAEQQASEKGMPYLMAVVKPSRTGCEAAASGALYCAAESALEMASPLTCVRFDSQT